MHVNKGRWAEASAAYQVLGGWMGGYDELAWIIRHPQPHSLLDIFELAEARQSC